MALRKQGARRWESRAELEAWPVHLHANTQNAFPPHTAFLNGSAQFGTVESLEHILRSLFATVGTSRPHTRCLQPRAPSWAAWQRPPALPRQMNLCVQPARGSISRTAGTKRPGPPAGLMARALGDSLGCGRRGCSRPQEAKGCSLEGPVPSFPWGARGPLPLPIALASMLSPPRAGYFPLPGAQSLACGGLGERVDDGLVSPALPGAQPLRFSQ